MSEKTAVHWIFWVIAVVALAWNCAASANYIMQMDAEFVASYPASHQAIINGRPWWATGGFAIGVFGGAVGCLLLLLRKSWATYVFLASLIGIAVTMIHTLGVANGPVAFTAMEVFVMALLPLIVAAFLLWYARYSESKGWIS